MRKQTLNTDPIAYRVDYSRVAQELHYRTRSKAAPKDDSGNELDELGPRATALAALLLDDKDHPPIELPATSERALELIERAREELVRIGWRELGREPRWYVRAARRRIRDEDRRLGRFLDAVLEPATVVVYFSTRVEAGKSIEPFEVAAPGAPVDRRAGSAADPDWLRAYLDRLVSLEEPPARGRLRSWWEALRWKRPKGVNYRVRYNVACMFSRIASRRFKEEEDAAKADLELAARHLERCVGEAHGRQRRALVDWAWKDPGLAGLQRLDRDRFASALALPDPRRDG